MKTKKPKRRYYTAHEIRKDIARYEEKMAKLTTDAEFEDMLADKFYAKGPEAAEEAGFHREHAKKLRRAISRIMEKKLPYLKDKLSEFMTDLLPGTGITDRSVES